MVKLRRKRPGRAAFVGEPLEARRLLSAALVKDINVVTPGSNPSNFIEVNGHLLFQANDGVHGIEWWTTDGTSAGTVEVTPAGRVQSNGDPAVATPAGLFFAGGSVAGGGGLWKTDGTDAGTVLVKSFDVMPSTLLAAGNNVYFIGWDASRSWEIWRSDGTAAGTIRLTNVPDLDGPPIPIGSLNDKMLFQRAPGTTTGASLWVTDGTPAGTSLVKAIGMDFLPIGPSASGGGSAVIDGQMYFQERSSGTSPGVLWRTDGTAAGTVRVPDVAPMPVATGKVLQTTGVYKLAGRLQYFADQGNAGFPDLGKLLLFKPTDLQNPNAGDTLYAYDGGAAGLVPLRDPGTVVQDDGPGIDFGGFTYFFTHTQFSDESIEMWRTDGTATGTTLVRTFHPPYGGGAAPVRSVGVSGSTMYFRLGADEAGAELWRSDGTAAGTTRIADLNTTGTADASPSAVVELNGAAVYAANDAVHGNEPWTSDGTAGGTHLLADIRPGIGNAIEPMYDPRTPDRLTVFSAPWNGRAYFAANDGVHGAELWATDGTAAGTVMVADVSPGPGSSKPFWFTPYNGRLYFTAASADGDVELWSTDGSAAGTRRVADVDSGPARSEVVYLTVAGGSLFFVVWSYDGDHLELWKTDGAEAGTARVSDVTGGFSDPLDYGGNLYFLRNSEMWRSDGTEAGTVQVLVPPPGAEPRQLRDIKVAGDWIIQSGADPKGNAIWRTDGTAAGTFRVKRFDMTDRFLMVTPASADDGAMYFRMSKLLPGGAGAADLTEVWRTDGTEAGTSLLYQTSAILPIYSAGNVENVSAAGGRVYFTQNDGPRGIELWATEPAAPAPLEIVGRHVFYNGSAFDGGDLGAGPSDDAAVATDKSALLPGQGGGTFANITSYPRGINGVMIDFAGSPPLTALAGLAGAATVKTGPGGDPATWAAAPAPSQIAIRPGAGVNGSTRVTLIWPDGAIKNTWLEVSIPAIPQAGMAQPDVFYFGNLVGENGDAGGVGAPRRVNALDLAAVKQKLNRPATIDDPADVNRDGRVNALDLGLVKANLNRSLSELVVPIPAAPIVPAQAPDRPPAPSLWVADDLARRRPSGPLSPCGRGLG